MIKPALLLISGIGLYKLFASSDASWKAVTEIALTRDLENEDIDCIVNLMADCDLIPRDQEAQLKHPFVKFWVRLVNTATDIADGNVDVLRHDAAFVKQAVRLCQNLEQEKASCLLDLF